MSVAASRLASEIWAPAVQCQKQQASVRNQEQRVIRVPKCAKAPCTLKHGYHIRLPGREKIVRLEIETERRKGGGKELAAALFQL